MTESFENNGIAYISEMKVSYDKERETITISRQYPTQFFYIEGFLRDIQFSSPQRASLPLTFTLTDMAGNSSDSIVTLVRDITVPTLVSAELVRSNQLSYKMVAVGANALGGDVETSSGGSIRDTTRTKLLTKNETVALPEVLTATGLTSTEFIKSLRGMYAEWGGEAIHRGVDTPNPAYYSYTSFSKPAVNTVGTTWKRDFVAAHQSSQFVKGDSFSLTADGAANSLRLKNLGGYYEENADYYRVGEKTGTAQGDYDIGNIRFLYQADTGNANNTTPTIRVKVTNDLSKTLAGDKISLYEGSKLLGTKVLRAEDRVLDPSDNFMYVNVAVRDSLTAGNHSIVARYDDPAGNTSQTTPINVSIAALPGIMPTLSNLKVKAANSSGSAVVLNDSLYSYATVTDTGVSTAGNVPGNALLFEGSVGGADAGETNPRYLITVSMGGKVLAFGEKVGAGEFSLRSDANALAPGFYKDLTITATNVANGLTTTVEKQTLGWYWAAFNLGNTAGGAGNDTILLGSTPLNATSPYKTDTIIQTGDGRDVLQVGVYRGSTSNLSATVSDFDRNTDKVSLFYNNAPVNLTRSNVDNYVSLSLLENGHHTKVRINLAGSGFTTAPSAAQTYELYLQNVWFSSSNEFKYSLFGI